jgi:hypothetical protein
MERTKHHFFARLRVEEESDDHTVSFAKCVAKCLFVLSRNKPLKCAFPMPQIACNVLINMVKQSPCRLYMVCTVH